MIAAINASHKFDIELQYDEEKDKNGNPYACTAWTMKNGRRVEGMRVTMDMADAEGWTKKNGSKWRTLPQLMLRYRAASFFSSLNCPELTMGIYTQEEIVDNDFDEPSDTIQLQMQQAIEDNANTVDFEPEKAENDTHNMDDVPEFMK